MKTTKELARELGLLRKRSSSATAQHLKRIHKTRQIFSYLIVIDFESTCWQDKRYRTQEIIEFPAVLLNTSNGEVESVFHHYVQPQENPLLSDFCRQLTGITQNQVDNGIPLNMCLTRFNNWLRRLAQDRGLVYNKPGAEVHAATFVSWSDWDFGVCLQYECRRKQLRKPAELNSWIDLRATYRNFYGRKPNGLNGALQDLGITFEGREHSGVDDAKNTAALAWRMMCDGCVMNITKSLDPQPGPASSSHLQTLHAHIKNKASSMLPAPPNKQSEQLQDEGSDESGEIPAKLRKVTSCGNNIVKVPLNTVSGPTKPGKKTTPSKRTTPRKGIIRSGPFKIFEDKILPSGINNKLTKETTVAKAFPVNENLSKVKVKVDGPNYFPGKHRPRNVNKALSDVSNYTAYSDGKNATLSSGTFKVPSHPAPDSCVKHSIGATKTPTPVCLTNSSTALNGTSETPSPVSLTSSNCKFKTPSSFSSTNPSGVPFKTPSPCLTAIHSKPPFTAMSGNIQAQSTTPANRSTLGVVSNMKRTPPMCECGRRSVQRVVQCPGPNTGRAFFSCPVGKRGTSGKKTGCSFFKWESSSPGAVTCRQGTLQGASHQKVLGNIHQRALSGPVNGHQRTLSGSSFNMPLLQPDFNTPNNSVKMSVGKTLGVKPNFTKLVL